MEGEPLQLTQVTQGIPFPFSQRCLVSHSVTGSGERGGNVFSWCHRTQGMPLASLGADWPS